MGFSLRMKLYNLICSGYFFISKKFTLAYYHECCTSWTQKQDSNNNQIKKKTVYKVNLTSPQGAILCVDVLWWGGRGGFKQDK